MVRDISSATARSITGMLTASSSDRCGSCCTAITTPPKAISGALTIIVRIISSAVCNCNTSLVLRAISDGVPKRFISCSEKPCTCAKTWARRSRP